MYKWTDEQEAIFSTIAHELTLPEPSEVSIDAVAGSSKTSSLVEAIKRIKQANPATTVRYLVFGALAAKEGRADFGTNAIVSTLHSLAFFYEVTNSNPRRFLPANRSYVSWQDIPKHIKRPFGIDFPAIQLVDAYCSSPFTDLASYVTYNNNREDSPLPLSVVKLAEQLLDLMYLGKMPCTHAFYLKVFHINLLNGLIQLPQTDILLLDESQDISSITKEILLHFPAKVKVLVGDTKQAIFGWMGCINAFDLYPKATKLQLTKSFRVNQSDARLVQSFMQQYVDPKFIFTGHTHTEPMPDTPVKAYLTRTNGALIAKMIELDANSIPYHLATTGKIDQMFKLPLAIAHTKPGESVPFNSPTYDIQHSVNEWASSPSLQKEHSSKYSYLIKVNADNPEVLNAVKMLVKYSYGKLKETAENAKAHVKSSARLRLMTIHVSKGSTADIVELDDDVNESLNELMIKLVDPSYKPDANELEQLYCYYVACTRHKYKLINASHLQGDN